MFYKAWMAVVNKKSATETTFLVQSNCQTAIYTDVVVLEIT